MTDTQPTETITDPAAIRATDEPDERGTPAPVGATVAALDLDAIEERAKRAAWGWGATWTTEDDEAEDWFTVHADGKCDMVGCEDRDVTHHIAGMDPAMTLALVAELRALRAEVELLRHLLGSHADGHRCDCTMLSPGSHIEPPEWEQNPWCMTHPDMGCSRGWPVLSPPRGPAMSAHWLIRYDPDDGEPYGEVCDCEIGDDHDETGEGQ